MFSLANGRPGLEVIGDSDIGAKHEQLRVFNWDHFDSHRGSAHSKLALKNTSVGQFDRLWLSSSSSSRRTESVHFTGTHIELMHAARIIHWY